MYSIAKIFENFRTARSDLCRRFYFTAESTIALPLYADRLSQSDLRRGFSTIHRRPDFFYFNLVHRVLLDAARVGISSLPSTYRALLGLSRSCFF